MTVALRDLHRVGTGPVLYQRLRPGPGLSPERVVANQRTRLCGALIELVADCGYRRVTVRELSRLAGVSTKTFYACFANVEDCFAATHARLIHDVLDFSSGTSADGEDRLRYRIATIFSRFANDEKGARLVLIESLSSGPVLLEATRCGSRTLQRLVRDEFAAPPCSVPVPLALADGIGAAILRIARTQLLADRPADSSVVADRFTDWLLALQNERLARMCTTTKNLVVTASPVYSHLPSRENDDRHFLLAAVTKLSMTNGYAKLTIPAIRQAAGVSRRSFNDNFDSVDDCFLAAVEDRVTGAIDRAEREAATAPSWERATVRMITCLCCEAARDPVLARLALVEILQPGHRGLELRESIVTRCAALLRQAAPASQRPSEVAAEASVAAIVSAATAEAVAGRTQRIRAAAPSMAFVGLAPAVGPAAAERAILAEFCSSQAASGSEDIL